MGDMGLQGAFASGSLQALLRQRMQDRIDAELRARHNFESDRAFGLASQAEQSNEQLKQATLGATMANRDAAQQDQLFKENQGLSEATPANTEVPQTSPIFGRLQSIGALAPKGITPEAPPAALAENPTAKPEEMPGTIANSPMPAGRLYRKLPTSKQAEAESTAKEKAAQNDTVNGIKQQLADIAAQKADQGPKAPTPHFSFFPTYENGQPTGMASGNTLTGQVNPVTNAPTIRPPVQAPGAGQNAQHEQAKKETLGILGQLDQAIDAAAPLIGPGSGRVSSIEQMVGNADPKIQALGVKMKAAKMAVDHAITGSTRAGASPTLLKQWDNILANNITPEGLKAAVQAMREVLGGGSQDAGGLPSVGGTFQGGKVLKVERVQ